METGTAVQVIEGGPLGAGLPAAYGWLVLAGAVALVAALPVLDRRDIAGVWSISRPRDKGIRSRTLRDLRPWGPPELGGGMGADRRPWTQREGKVGTTFDA